MATPILHPEPDGKGPWLAGCPSYSRRFTSEQRALDWIAYVEGLGACRLRHVVVAPDGEG